MQSTPSKMALLAEMVEDCGNYISLYTKFINQSI